MENTHTHEVWIGKADPNVKTQIAHKGGFHECFKYVDNVARKDQMGAGYLLRAGTYDIVELAEERKLKMEAAAPELLRTLNNLLAVCNVDKGIKYIEAEARAAIKRATLD